MSDLVALIYLTAGLGSSFGVFDDVLKCQGSVKHHRLLTRNHLSVYGVVEMSNLEKKWCQFCVVPAVLNFLSNVMVWCWPISLDKDIQHLDLLIGTLHMPSKTFTPYM